MLHPRFVIPALALILVAFELNVTAQLGGGSYGNVKVRALYADGRPAEIFLDAEKQAVDAANDARDLALAVSIGLQHGVPLETLRHAALRDAAGAPQGLLGAVCDALAVIDEGCTA